jgi:hypothetical protein
MIGISCRKSLVRKVIGYSNYSSSHQRMSQRMFGTSLLTENKGTPSICNYNHVQSCLYSSSADDKYRRSDKIGYVHKSEKHGDKKIHREQPDRRRDDVAKSRGEVHHNRKHKDEGVPSEGSGFDFKIDKDVMNSLQSIFDVYRYAVSQFTKNDLAYGHTTMTPWEDASFLIMHELALPFDDPLSNWGQARLTTAEKQGLLSLIYERIESRFT